MEMPPYGGTGRPPLYHKACTPKAMQARRMERKRGGKPPQSRHTLSDIDEATRAATCVICGPTVAYRVNDTYKDGRPRVRWICKTRYKTTSANSRRRFESSEKGMLLKFRNRYGLTHDQAEAAIAAKGAGCRICGSDATLVYDHDHVTGAHRGWLCHSCNLGLGKFLDRADLLRAAADYLEGTP